MPLDEASVQRLAGAALSAVDGMSLVAADAVLDDVRRVVWSSSFTGEPIDPSPLEAHPAHKAIVRAVAGLSIAEFNRVIDAARQTMWGSHFAARPDSRFGALANEEGGAPAGKTLQ